MKLFEVNRSPSPRELRQFGAICFFAILLVNWFWDFNWSVATFLTLVGACIFILAWVRPGLVRPIFITLVTVAAPIGLLLGELTMLTIFLALFCPMAFIFRCLRRDALERKFQRTADSYWNDRPNPRQRESYFRRF